MDCHHSFPSIAEELIGSSCLDGVGMDLVGFSTGTSTWMMNGSGLGMFENLVLISLDLSLLIQFALSMAS
jgi:hypothetical protein